MSRKFIAAVVAVAISVTAVSSAPARADDDAIKIIIGAATLFALTKALKDDKKQNHATVSRTSPTYPPRVKPRPLPRSARYSKVVPQGCLIEHKVRNGKVRLLGQRCMHRNYRHAKRLPQSCRTSVRTRDGLRHGYKPRCLKRNGYRMARF